MPRRALAAALAAVLAAVLLGACTDEPPPTAPRGDAVVVASFDFPESVLLGELYAQALESAGVEVRRELGLGPRELVLPALRQGLVDVVPEYLGSALSAVTGSAVPGAAVNGSAVNGGAVDGTAVAGTPATPAAARQALADGLRADGLQVLTPARAQNTNGLAVTRATAQRLGLRTTSDLRPVAGRLRLGGPPECPRRPYCLLGLQRTYGLAFGGFTGFPRETQRVTALEQGVIDVAVVFTTDGLLAEHDLVVLQDDRHLQPVESVVPVVTADAVRRAGPRLERALDAVSARLDSAALAFLNWRVDVAGKDVAAEARGWRLRHGLDRPAG